MNPFKRPEEEPSYQENLQARLNIQRMDSESAHERVSHRIVQFHPVETFPQAKKSPLSSLFNWDLRSRLETMFRSVWQTRSEVILFAIALTLYLGTRLIGLDDYPIYFLGDEAIHTVYAAELIHSGGEIEGTFLPTYFKNGTKYNLSLSVYVQVLPTWLFGKSVAVTRATSVLITLIPAAIVAWMVRDFLKMRYGWLATLLLSVVPVWFLHSRTALETVLAVSMYAGFLYFYLRYRLDHPKYLYAALIFGALTFYAYSPAQVVIVVFAGILLLLDIRYHLKNWQTTVGGVGLLVILIWPYLRFRLQVNAPIEEHLRDLGSYWLDPAPLSEKLMRFFSLYVYGLSPGYWFFPNQQDLARHQMGQYGNIMGITLPFALVGTFIALKSVVTTEVVPPQRLKSLLQGKIRFLQTHLDEPRIYLTYRTLLLALLVAPLPGTLAQVGNTRILTFIIPITILTAVGLITVLEWLETQAGQFLPKIQDGLAPGVFVVLGLGLGLFTADTLRNGLFWHQDYGFSGMQYGARQVYDKIHRYLDSYNSIQIVLTPEWANNSDHLTNFFLNDPFAIEMASVDSFLIEEKFVIPNHLIILTPHEYERAQESGKFSLIEVVDTVDYPNGKPGFYFLRLTYMDNISEILAEEREARKALVEGTVTFEGIPAQVRHSQLDIGTIDQVFDGNEQTLIRTREANPAIIELTFAEPRPIQEVAMVIGADKIQVSFWITTDPDQPPIEVSQIIDGRESPREKVINFGETYNVQTLLMEVLSVEQGEPGHVHIWDIWLR